MNRKRVLKKLVLLTAMMFLTFLLAGCGSAGVGSASIKVQVVEVLNSAESTVSSAIVGIESDATGSAPALHRQLINSNNTGNTYVFEDLPPGVVYQIYVEAAGYVNDNINSQSEATGGAPNRADPIQDRAYKTIKTEDGQDYFVKIYMKRNPTPSTGDLAGVVKGVDPNNANADSPTLANATVVLANQDNTAAYATVTGNNGAYNLERIPVEPDGYRIMCYAANDQGATEIYRPLETTGGGEHETGTGSNSEVYIAPGEVAIRDIYLEKATIESVPETTGTITATVYEINGLAIDFASTPIFATIYRDGERFRTVRVENEGLITFDSLPVTDSGITYNRMDLHSSFIENSPIQFTGFEKTLKTTDNTGDAGTVNIELKTGDLNVTVSTTFSSSSGTGLAGASVTTQVTAEGGNGNASVTNTSPSAAGGTDSNTRPINNIPIGKRKISAVTTPVNQGTGTGTLSAQLANSEVEVIVISNSASSATFTVTAIKQ